MRNPFSVDDVVAPNDSEVEDFARDVAFPPDPTTDENALAWVAVAVASADDGLAGPWTSRWRVDGKPWMQGVATVHLDGDRAFILYKGDGSYLIEAAVRDDRLVGRYVNIDDRDDTSPWVGRIIDPYRIDGYWRRGRWDLRRCSPDERPEPIISALVTEARLLGPSELRELLGFARYLRWRAGSDS